MEGTNVQIGVSIKGCPTASGVESVESEDPVSGLVCFRQTAADRRSRLINFKIAVAKPGDQAVGEALFLRGCALSGANGTNMTPSPIEWYDFSAYAKFASDRRSVDADPDATAGPGDADGVANGVIVDHGGHFWPIKTKCRTTAGRAEHFSHRPEALRLIGHALAVLFKLSP
ncbi:MAG: hypothetical protein MZV70_12015 [Desulfobacterales bacterium]|nr:hypothetical protein [Desulfobacterales bacterium]